MDLVLRFDVTAEEGINRGLLAGHPCGKDYAAIVSSNRLASINLSQQLLVGDLIGDGETWYFVEQPHPDIKLHSIDLFPQAVFITNYPEYSEGADN